MNELVKEGKSFECATGSWLCVRGKRPEKIMQYATMRNQE